jgi:hypothetical protein
MSPLAALEHPCGNQQIFCTAAMFINEVSTLNDIPFSLNSNVVNIVGEEYAKEKCLVV